jgi:hypothetical protein
MMNECTTPVLAGEVHVSNNKNNEASRQDSSVAG